MPLAPERKSSPALAARSTPAASGSALAVRAAPRAAARRCARPSSARPGSAAHDVPEAAGERAQLARERRRRARAARRSAAPRAPRVRAARTASAGARPRPRGGARRPPPRRRGRARRGVCGAQPFLPLLLVAAVLERRVERPDALERARGGSPCSRPTRSARRCRRAPSSSVVIGGASRPQVRGAGPSRRATIAPGEHVDLRDCARGRVEQRLQPALAAARTSSSTNTTSSPARALDAGVARDVQPERRAGAARSARRSAPPARARSAMARRVVDDEHLGARRGRLRRRSSASATSR